MNDKPITSEPELLDAEAPLPSEFPAAPGGFDYLQLGPLAGRVRVTEERIRLSGRKSVEALVSVGEDLIEMRQELRPLGLWLDWLVKVFAWSEDTANRWIWLAERSHELMHVDRFPVSALYILCNPNTPPEARAAASTLAAAGQPVTTAVAKSLRDEALDDGEDEEVETNEEAPAGREGSNSGLDSEPEDDDEGSADGMAERETPKIQRPFAALPPLPADVSDAFEDFKMTILRHKVAGWQDISRGDLLLSLDALKQLALADSE